MNLFVVRHAEADHNVNNLANDASSSISNLTQKGEQQAATLAIELADQNFNVVFTSELPRTIATANILVGGRNLTAFKDSRLNDIVTGISGRPYEEFRQMVKSSSDMWNFSTELGESFNDEKQRIISFMEHLKTLPYEDVLIVTHGGVANIMYGLTHDLSEKEIFESDIKNCGVYRIVL